MGRAAGSLQGFLCTVYTDVILILSHLWGDPNTHLMEPLIAAPVTLHPVHLQESTSATDSLLQGRTHRHRF